MPELAEVAYFRRVWADAAAGARIRGVSVHEHARVLRGVDVALLGKTLPGSRLVSSEASGKQMIFRFRPAGQVKPDAWLGVHLGMTGELMVETLPFRPGKHDHLALETDRAALVFRDFRKFGRIRFDLAVSEPKWWETRAADVLSRQFSLKSVEDFLKRRGRAPIKAVLLMQEQFPGIGNWMADEILWRAGIHPRRPAGSLETDEVRAIWRETRTVSRLATAALLGRAKTLPAKMDSNRIPETWLFHHRWRAGGRCPKTGALLKRATIGGRTTCWSPPLQQMQR